MFFKAGTFFNSPIARGAFWKVSAFLCFSMINGIVRYLSQTSESLGTVPMPSYEVAFFQNFFGLLFMLPWIFQQGLPHYITKKPVVQAARILFSAVGVVLWYAALDYMPLSQAVALMFLGPLITALGARMFLGEHIGIERGLAIGVGFIGGALITQSHIFSGAQDWLSLTYLSLIPIVGACCFSAATLLIRHLGPYDSPQLSVLYSLVFMAPLLMIPTLIYGEMPQNWQWTWLVGMGALSAIANYCLNRAYTTAEVSSLIPYGFTKWFASTLIGFAAFGEIPTLWTTCGALVVMSSIVILSIIEAKRKRYRT